MIRVFSAYAQSANTGRGRPEAPAWEGGRNSDVDSRRFLGLLVFVVKFARLGAILSASV